MKIDKLLFLILRYLYETSDLPTPSMEPISAEALKVPLEQWNNAVSMLHEEGYVKGAVVRGSKTGVYILNEEDMRITIKGIDYFKSNTRIQKIYGSCYRNPSDIAINTQPAARLVFSCPF